MTIMVSPRKLILFLTALVLFLILANVASSLLKCFLDHDTQLGFYRLFDLHNENNIPTWYASSALLFCVSILAGISLYKRRIGDCYAGHWLGLAVIFLFLSVDEAASIHEEVGILMMRSSVTTFEGYLFYHWVIPFGTLTLLMALLYLRFLASLPHWTKYQFIIAGIFYVGGALGFEMLGARHHSLYGSETLTYGILTTIEEA